MSLYMDQHAVDPTLVSTFVSLVASIYCNIGNVNQQFYLIVAARSVVDKTFSARILAKSR